MSLEMEESEHAGSCKLNNLLAELMLYYLQVYLYLSTSSPDRLLSP